MQATGSSNDEETSSTSQLWKITSGKNGEKYLTFSNKTRPSTSRGLSSGGDEIASEEDDDQPITIRVYKIRWFILICICFAQISNSINWICYSPIADFTGQFYSVDYQSVNFLSLSYLIITIPAGFFSFWLADNFGVRTSINMGTWLNLIGSLIRALSSIDSANGEPLIRQDLKYGFLLAGQCTCALAQPFLMFVTTKFANTWFADDQRAMANTLALGSNTLGILIGSFMSPLIVESSVKFVSEMCLLNLICLGVSLVPTIMTGFVTRSTPKSPPSYSAIMSAQVNERNSQYVVDGEAEPSKFKLYFIQIAKLLKSKDFLILLFSFGVALGLFNSLTTLLEQILCVRGYDDLDVGYFGAAMIISGMIGSIIAGIILDKTKRFEETAKVCFSLSALGGILVSIVQLYNNDKSTLYYLLLFAFAWIGFFGVPLLPVCMEMSVECVYPIPEATSTGILFMGGQIVGILMILLYPATATRVDPNSYEYLYVQTCQSTNGTSWNSTTTTTAAPSSSSLAVLDFRYQMYFQAVVQVAITIVFVIFFKCAYLRLRSEREKLAEKILNSARI